MQIPLGSPGGIFVILSGGTGGGDLPGGLFCLLVQGAADGYEVFGDDAEPDPALHSGLALVAAAVEAVSAFGHADAPLASGAPFLAVAEPALLLFTFARVAFGGAIGNADALDAFGFRRCLVAGRVECGIRGDEPRNAAEPGPGDVHGPHQYVEIAR